MDNFKDAFLKRKIVTEEHIAEIDLKDELEKKEVQRKKDEAEKLASDLREKEHKEQIKDMNKFQNLYDNEKSRKFIIHLMYAFLSETKVRMALEDSDLQSKTCCICKIGVVSSFGVMRKLDFSQMIRDSLNGVEGIMHEFYKNNKIGIISEESRSVLCNPCYVSFRNWIIARFLSYDTTVITIVNKVRNAENFEKFTEQKNRIEEDKRRVKENLKMHFIAK
jgi:hypothetical protein